MDPGTHPVAAGFDRVADRYERGRPDYPTAAVDFLAESLGIRPGRTVLDVGAGTGKFTREILRYGAAVTAVEPMPQMRARFTERLPTVPLLVGTAEHLPVPDAGVDAITCAQAFHWFETAAAAREFVRVLRPGGGVGLIWNIRDERVPWVHELTTILDRYDAGGPRGRSQAWRRPLEETGLFTPIEHRAFEHVQRAPVETIVDRALSVSYIGILPPETQAAIADQVRALLARSEETRDRAEITLPYRTDAFVLHCKGDGTAAAEVAARRLRRPSVAT